MNTISRRKFFGGMSAAMLATMLGACASTECKSGNSCGKTAKADKFKMKFAPRGLFAASCGKDPFKRFKWLSENGFWAVEGVVFVNPDKIYKQEEINLQRALGAYAREVGLEMGCVSSMNNKDFPVMTANQVPVKGKVIRDKKAVRDCLARQMDNTFAVMERLGSKQFIIGAGTNDSELSPEKQYENTVENMAFCADYCKRYGFTMEIEPLNTKSHPNLYIDRAELGAKIVRDVNNPHCRLLFDIFHEQMQVGSLDALDKPEVWNCIESFHIADAPSRQEPGTGNIDYKKVLKKIWDKGYRGFIGLEHGQTDKSLEGDRKLLQIYRDLDSVVA